MDSLLLGIVAALCWGTADFAARFSGRALGAAPALLGVMAAGTLGMGLWLAVSGSPAPDRLSWFVLGNGVCGLAGLLLLYEALRRGRVAAVVPLVGAFPAWALAMMVVFQGLRPPPEAWLAMGATMAGVWVVARFSPDEPGTPASAGGGGATPIALLAGALFGASLVFGQYAAEEHGEAGALFLARAVGLVMLAGAVVARGGAGLPRPRWLPLLAVQGMLDAGGFLALLFAGQGEGGAEATVVSSTFGLVTIALARLFLREGIVPMQWLGIALTFGGVAALSAQG